MITVIMVLEILKAVLTIRTVCVEGLPRNESVRRPGADFAARLVN